MFINLIALVLESVHLTFIKAEQLNVGPIDMTLMKQDTAWSTFPHGTMHEDCDADFQDTFVQINRFTTVCRDE